MVDAEGRLRELSGVEPDLAGAVLGSLPRVNPEALPLVPGAPRLGPPVGAVGKIVGIGLDYSDHAAEIGAPAPAEPIVFLKAATALAGLHDPLVLPRGAARTDWEVELGVVVGRRMKHVSAAQALRHVAGYTILNDISERAWQLEGTGQWTKGESHDGFAPIGPMARDARGAARRAVAGTLDACERRADADRHYRADDLRRGRDPVLSQ